MTESAIIKFICANHGSINTYELVVSDCFGSSQDVWEVIRNREKFATCSHDGEPKVVAKTTLRVCRNNNCPGCGNLHLCRKFLFGSCPFGETRRGCRFPHQLNSGHNAGTLQRHGLEGLDRAELCTLLLQNDHSLLPPICYDYNNGDGLHGRCQDGESCTRLHICEKYLKGACSCPRAHDFYEPHPLKTLQGRGVPTQLMLSLKFVYMNKEALKGFENRGNRGNQGNRGNRGDRGNRGGNQGNPQQRGAGFASDVPEGGKDKTDICMYFIKDSCKHGDRCFKVHSRLPYLWEVKQAAGWTALPNNEDIEKDYCDPEKTYSRCVQPVCFDTMTCSLNKTRRLSTVSSVLQPNFILTTTWAWHWEDEFGNWNLYAAATGARRAANISSADLEQKYLNDDKDVVEFSASSQTYTLNFQDMIQTNKQYGTKRLVRRRPVFVSSADVQMQKARGPLGNQPSFKALPGHWDKTQIPERGYKRVALQSSSMEYKEIEGLFRNTMRGFDIVQIERIQNKALWEIFQWQRDLMKKNNGGQIVTEKKLFHGTDSKHVDAISFNNFDWRICGTHGTAFGKGSYFARDAKYSHSYTCESKTMFVSRVLVGDVTRGSSDYLRPPSKDGGDTLFYDTCVDDVRNPSIFVVFEKQQIYPEYLLQYKEEDFSLYYGASSVHVQVARPVAPVSRPVPTLSTPVPAVSRPVATLSTPVPPVSRPVPTLSTPVPPVSRPVATLSTPVPPVSRPFPTLSTPVPPVSRPVPAVSRPVARLSTPVALPGRTVPIFNTLVPPLSAPVLQPSRPVNLFEPVLQPRRSTKKECVVS